MFLIACELFQGFWLIYLFIYFFNVVKRVRKKETRRRNWCSKTRFPAGCGCAPAPIPPPKSWCWTPVSPLTCSTASTPATPTWFALQVCQVGSAVCRVCLCRMDFVLVFVPHLCHIVYFHFFSPRCVGDRLSCR